jgi:hypothetical protein
MKCTIKTASKIRGFHALTQGQERLEEKLVDNINELEGKRFLGFKKTRIEVLSEEFDREAVEQMVVTSVELTKQIGTEVADEYIRKMMKQMLERIHRDHVSLDMVHEFRKAYSQKVDSNDGDIEKTVSDIENYFQCGRVVPVSQTYMEISEELERGETVYYEPKNRAV